jgi:hypothetical protein
MFLGLRRLGTAKNCSLPSSLSEPVPEPVLLDLRLPSQLTQPVGFINLS